MSALDLLVEQAIEGLTGACGAPPGTPLVAACSGGSDSVGLVAVLAELADRWPLREVIFVDHGLRDVSAEAEAARQAAERADVPFGRAVVRLGDGNLQGEARIARYRALLDAAPAPALVATGHTLDDQAETVLHRVLRRSGLTGLGGIRPRQGRIIRPLLGARRDALRSLDLPFAEDPSNATTRFQRNRLRHQVLPALLAEAPDAVEALAAVAEQARGERDLIQGLMMACEVGTWDLRGWSEAGAGAYIRQRVALFSPEGRPSGAALRVLARRLVLGDDGGVSLGDGLRGTARAGRLSLGEERDPRREVVVPGPGVYCAPGVTLVVGGTLSSEGSSDLERGSCHRWLSGRQLRWPMRVERRPHNRAGGSLAEDWRLRDGVGDGIPWHSGDLTTGGDTGNGGMLFHLFRRLEGG